MGLLWPSHADTALTFRPLCSQWRAQLWRRLWEAGPLTPVPVAAACNPTFAIPSEIQRAALLGDSGLPPRPVNTLSAGLR